MAAVSTILLRRSSACIISGGQFYCRYLSTAANRSRLFVPTAISSVRQFSSSPVVNITQTPSPDVEKISQQAINNDQLVRDVLAQLGSLRGEIESLRKAKEEPKEEAPREEEKEEVVVVKEKHPLLKAIESEISKTQFTSLADKLPEGFEVVCDKPGVAKVTLKKSYKKENISIELFNPSYCDYADEELRLIVKVSFSRIFSSTAAEFHCFVSSGGELTIDRIKDPNDGPHNEGVIFHQLPGTLQKEFYDYLEVRGVGDGTSGLLCDYLQDKMKRENMRGLGKFKKLVEDA